MSEDLITERLEILLLVLQYTHQVKPILSVGERIMINQERGHLFRMQDDESLTNYDQSNEIENKIYQCLALIRLEQWQPMRYINNEY